jgi:signal transduction histidine kinase
MARLQRTLLAPVVLLFVAVVAALGYTAWDARARTAALRLRVERVEQANTLILRLNLLEREALVNVMRHAADRSHESVAQLARLEPETARTIGALQGLDSSPGGRRLLSQYAAVRAARVAAGRDLLEAARADDGAAVAAATRRWNFSRVRGEALLADVSAYNLNLLKRTLRDLDVRRSASVVLLAIAFGLSLGVVLAYGWYVSRRVVGPVSALTRAARDLPGGPFVPPPAALLRADEIGVLARTLVDVTQEMRVANERMSEAVRARDEFLTVASHELRTPLTSLKLHLQSSPARAAMSGGDAPRWLGVSLRQVGRLERLVSELLDVTRIRGGRVVLQRQETNLAAVVEAVVERLAAELRHGGHEVALALQPAVGTWDPSRLDQIVTNLVTNVIRHAPGAPLRIAVETREAEAVLSVCDGGPGIPEEARDRLFHYFEQGAGARAGGGLGLGLFISRSLAEAHGGTLRLESTRPGAEFLVKLPIDPPVQAIGSPARRPSP